MKLGEKLKMSKLNNKINKVDNVGTKKLRKLHDIDKDLKYWDLIEDDAGSVYYIRPIGYKQYELDISKTMMVPTKIGKRNGN